MRKILLSILFTKPLLEIWRNVGICISLLGVVKTKYDIKCFSSNKDLSLILKYSPKNISYHLRYTFHLPKKI